MERITLVYLACLLSACNLANKRNAVDKSEQDRDSTTISSGPKYWISESYFQCMAENLPCHCSEQFGLGFSLVAYKESEGKLSVYENGGEISELLVRQGQDNTYSVYPTLDGPPLFSLTVANDTLFLINGSNRYRYVNDPELVKWESTENPIGKLNLELLVKRSHSLLFLKRNGSTTLNCNKELGDINLVSTSGDCKNMQILELENNSILIYKYLNSCDDKSYPFKVEKKLIGEISR